MKINLVSFDDRLIAVGFRKVASFVKSINPDTHTHYLTLSDALTPLRLIIGNYGEVGTSDQKIVRQISETLAQGDILGISSMTSHAEMTKQIIKEVKAINPKTFVVWGGIHPIIEPDDAIAYPDAICTGEGEFAFEELLTAIKEGKDYTRIKNFWFNESGKITRNDFRPLATSEELSQFPIPQYGEDELIFKTGKGFVPITPSDYLSFNGLAFNAVWSIGCPYKCTYCGNTTFIENDKNYRKIRHTSVDHLIRQIKDVIKKHPFVQTISFQDDSFMAIPKRTLQEFAEKWKREIGLPFAVYGVIPSFVKEDKFEILAEAGMNRIRMGIQSGSDRILQFYQRPNKPGLIRHTTSIIAKFNDFMLPPAYDIIVDNPIETTQDVIDTLELLYDMPRPFTLNVLSLRVIKNSVLERQLYDLGLMVEDINSNYTNSAPTLANITVYLLAVWRPPRWLFDFLLKSAKPFREKQPRFQRLMWFVRSWWLIKRGLGHIRFMDFSLIPGPMGWILWKLGVIKFYQENIKKQYKKREILVIEKKPVTT